MSHYDYDAEGNPVESRTDLSPEVSRLLGPVEDDTASYPSFTLQGTPSGEYPSYGFLDDYEDLSGLEGYDPEDHDLAQAILASMLDGEGDELETTAASAVGPAHRYMPLRDGNRRPHSTRTRLPEAPNHGQRVAQQHSKLPRDKPGRYPQQHPSAAPGGRHTGLNFEQEALHQLANVFGGKNKHAYNLATLREAYGKLLAAAHEAKGILRKARMGQQRGAGGKFKGELGHKLIKKNVARTRKRTSAAEHFRMHGIDPKEGLAREAALIHRGKGKN